MRISSPFGVVALLLLHLTSSGEAQTRCKVRLGALLPLTGAGASMGEHFRQSMELARQELPSDIQQRLVLKFEDTAMNPAKAVGAIRSLMDSGGIDVAAVTFAESVSAISPIAEQRKLTTFALTPVRESVAGRKYMFRHWLGSETMTPVIINELLRRGIQSVALVYSEHPAMSDFAKKFKSAANENHIALSFDSSVLPSETDFRTIGAGIAAKKPQAIVYFLLPPQPSVFAKQVAQFKIPLFSFINTESLNEVKAANGALEGVVYAGTKLDPEFVTKFKAKFNGDYPESYSGNLYDIVKIVAQAVEAGKCNSDEIRDYLENLTEFQGSLGTYGADKEHEFNFPVVLKTIKNGDFRVY